MAVNTEANDALDRVDDDRIYELKARLEDLADVAVVSNLDHRTPARLRVELEAANVTPPVEDLIEEYRADICPDSIAVSASNGLEFEVTTPEGFKPAGSRETREYGPSSVSITLTREALETSGFDESTPVNVYGRDGAILLERQDYGGE